MATAEFWQRGESLDYTNNTGAVIPHNTILQIGSRLGVTGTVIEPGKIGSIHVGGVWEIAKTGTTAITMGQTVYFDGTGITDASSDGADTNPTAYVEAGYAAADAAADADTILVKLRG